MVITLGFEQIWHRGHHFRTIIIDAAQYRCLFRVYFSARKSYRSLPRAPPSPLYKEAP